MKVMVWLQLWWRTALRPWLLDGRRVTMMPTSKHATSLTLSSCKAQYLFSNSWSSYLAPYSQNLDRFIWLPHLVPSNLRHPIFYPILAKKLLPHSKRFLRCTLWILDLISIYSIYDLLTSSSIPSHQKIIKMKYMYSFFLMLVWLELSVTFQPCSHLYIVLELFIVAHRLPWELL